MYSSTNTLHYYSLKNIWGMHSSCTIEVNEVNYIKKIPLIKYEYYVSFSLNAKLCTPLSVRTQLEPNIYATWLKWTNLSVTSINFIYFNCARGMHSSYILKRIIVQRVCAWIHAKHVLNLVNFTNHFIFVIAKQIIFQTMLYLCFHQTLEW
jgi:hypothetical protein